MNRSLQTLAESSLRILTDRTNYTQLATTKPMQLTPTARLEPTQIHLLATNVSSCVLLR